MNERGTVFVVVAILLGLVAMLAAGLSLSASSVSRVARNHVASARARVAADRGLEQAVATAVPTLQAWREAGFASAADGLGDALAGGAMWQRLVAAGFPRTLTLGTAEGAGGVDGAAGSGGADVTVTVDLLDDDAPARGLAAADIAAIGEDGRAGHDANGRIVLRATAKEPGGARATVEAVVGVTAWPALTLGGAATLDAVTVEQGVPSGDEGRVTVAGPLTITGPVVASGDVLTGGSLTGAAYVTAPRVAARARVPAVSAVAPTAWRSRADVELRADGTAWAEGRACQPPDVTCPEAARPWRWAGDAWTLVAVPAGAVTAFADGDVVLQPDPAASGGAAGGGSGADIVLSLAATGSVRVPAGLRWRPARGGLLAVAGGDVDVVAGMAADAEPGWLAAGGALRVHGPARLRGAALGAGPGPHVVAAGVAITTDGGLAAAGVMTVRVLGFRRDQAW